MYDAGSLSLNDARLLRATHEEVNARLAAYAALNAAWPIMIDALLAIAHRIDAGAPMDGALEIARERARQVDEERYTSQHDDSHSGKELIGYGVLPLLDKYTEGVTYGDPWDLVLKHGDNPVRMLTIAGALIAAELDRLQRQTEAIRG